jgi:hypothetical protein
VGKFGAYPQFSGYKSSLGKDYLTFLLSMTEEFLVQALLLSAGIR